MIKQLISACLVIAKIYLGIKILFWVIGRIQTPELYPTSDIDWAVVMIILDMWLMTHIKIEIPIILKKNNDTN